MGHRKCLGQQICAHVFRSGTNMLHRPNNNNNNNNNDNDNDNKY